MEAIDKRKSICRPVSAIRGRNGLPGGVAKTSQDCICSAIVGDSGISLGVLFNFNVRSFKDGIRRVVLNDKKLLRSYDKNMRLSGIMQVFGKEQLPVVAKSGAETDPVSSNNSRQPHLLIGE
jgi:hypothetical protein